MKTFLASVVIAAIGLCCARGAEVDPEALGAIKSFAAKQEAALSNLKSFDMSGTIKIVLSNEFAKAQNPPVPKVSERKFRIIAGPEDIKETIETLDEAGKVVRSEVYYLDNKRVIWADDLDGLSIKPFDLGENNGLFNVCPSFFENSFINLDVTYAGIPALLISDLGSKRKWSETVQSLQSAKVGSDDHVYATITGRKGHSAIELVKRPNPVNDYQVSSIRFFTKDDILDRKVEMLASSNIEGFGEIGKAFRVNVYSDSIDVPSVTWEYNITDLKLNCPIDTEGLHFNPLAVHNIVDAEQGCYVTMVK